LFGIRKKKTIFLISLLVLLLIGFAFGYKITRTDKFCTSCHSMTRYAKSISLDKYHRQIDCVSCHLPGGFFKQLYAQPVFVIDKVLASMKQREDQVFIAHVDDENCTSSGCHDVEIWDSQSLERDIDCFKPFRHHTHFDPILPDGLSLSCSSCHNKSNEMQTNTHFAVSHLNCFPCHIREGIKTGTPLETLVGDRVCLICHGETSLSNRVGHNHAEAGKFNATNSIIKKIPCVRCHPAFKEPAPPVHLSSCRKCHKEWNDMSAVNIDLMHATHISEKNADCLQCHVSAKHNAELNSIEAQANCINCHSEDEKKFNIAMNAYIGGWKGKNNLPDPMATAGVSCAACHRRGIGTDACTNGVESCTICHIKSYSKLIDNWQKTIRRKVVFLQQQINNAPKSDKIQKRAKETQNIINKIRNDGSWGVHNIVNINGILNQSEKKLQSIISKDGK